MFQYYVSRGIRRSRLTALRNEGKDFDLSVIQRPLELSKERSSCRRDNPHSVRSLSRGHRMRCPTSRNPVPSTVSLPSLTGPPKMLAFLGCLPVGAAYMPPVLFSPSLRGPEGPVAIPQLSPDIMIHHPFTDNGVVRATHRA